MRSAEAVGAEEGFETGEGVGEFVRVAQGALEEMMLGFAREGGSQLKGPRDDRGGSANGIEMGVKKTEESGRMTSRFGEPQVAEVEVAVVEGEAEAEGDGGTLGGGKTSAEGVESAVQEKEERFESFERVLEFLCELELLCGTMEGEEAVVFAVQDVVQAGGIRAEAFGEALAWEGGEVTESLDAPEVE